jgi:hypothetical protein
MVAVELPRLRGAENARQARGWAQLIRINILFAVDEQGEVRTVVGNKDIAPLIDRKYVWDKPGEQGVLRGKGSAKPQNEGCNFLSDLRIDEADLREIEMIRASAPSTSLGVQETRMAN